MADDDGAGTGEAERLTLFSDAVVAIAITLLALGLHVPDGHRNADLWRDLTGHLSDYVAFLISFAVIGSHWLLHHRVFSRPRALTGWLIRWNMLWLLTIVLTPFATRVIVGEGAFAARFTLYAAIQVLAAGFLLLAVAEMNRHHLTREDAARDVLFPTYIRLALVAGLFLVSIPLAFAAGHWAYACWVAIPLASRLIPARRAARRAHTGRGADL